MTHRGSPVKWIGKDGGFKTGFVLKLDGIEVRHTTGLVVQHSCGLTIEAVDESKLTPWLEWEVESGS
jgi:hypothetical protein